MAVDGVFHAPFQEQLSFFRRKIGVPTERWDDIRQSAHDRFFMVAGAMKADLVADLKGAVEKAIEKGESIQEFRRRFDAIVDRHGWHGWTGEDTPAGRDWRTRIIYRTNLQTSWAAGRYRQLKDPDLLSLRPYWRYIHNDSVIHPRPLHQHWGDIKLTLRHDDPFWETHYPPNGWNCSCRVKAVRGPEEGDATRPPDGWDAIDAKTGAPEGIDRGWDYAPGENANTALSDLVSRKLLRLDAPIGGAMWESLKPVLLREQAAAFSGFVDAALSGPPAGRNMVAGSLKPSWIREATDAGLAPASADITVRDEDVWHTFRDGKVHPLDLDWYRRLPEHLDAPDAVLLDSTHPREPAFLLIYSTGDGRADKLVVRINYRIKKVGLGNIVQTGKIIKLDDIRAQVGHGYKLVEGGL